MDTVLLDIGLFIAGGLFGFAGRYVWHSCPTVPAIREVPERLPQIPLSPGRVRVLFEFADGTRERKTLFEHSLKPVIRWRQKKFNVILRNGPEAHYKEQV